MLPRIFYRALMVWLFHGDSEADEAPVFTPPTANHPLKVKVVIVAMFEVGANTGDIPGEFQFWVERRKPDHVITGAMQALTNLAKAGRVDLNRVLVLRTASNFDSPPPGVSAAQDLKDQESGHYSAYIPSLEAAFTVGNQVASELIDHWDTYSTQIPTGSESAKSN
jgi:purine nucleoside permease